MSGRLRAGKAWRREYDLVCSQQNGESLNRLTVSSAFRDTARRAGMETSFHALRHAHASILIKEGEHMKVMSQRLGHSSIDVRMDT